MNFLLILLTFNIARQSSWDEKDLQTLQALSSPQKPPSLSVDCLRAGCILSPYGKMRVWLGTFPTAEDAANAYDDAARILCGHQAKTNFPRSPSSASVLNPAVKEKLLRCCLESTKQLQNAQELCIKEHCIEKCSGFLSSKYATFQAWTTGDLEEISDGSRYMQPSDHMNFSCTQNSKEECSQCCDDIMITEMINELLQSTNFDIDFPPQLPKFHGSSCSDSLLQCFQLDIPTLAGQYSEQV